jgi:hypothetical protein
MQTPFRTTWNEIPVKVGLRKTPRGLKWGFCSFIVRYC